MSNSVKAKYLHVSKTNQPGKWKTINLCNLSKELTVQEAKCLLDELWEYHTGEQNKRVKKLKELKAPDCILELHVKAADRLTRKVHVDLTPLKKVIKEAA